jgi:hypothetical protein
MTHRELSVDPNGVIRTGTAYTEGGKLLREYLRQLGQLRSTYHDSWGDDELGQKFSQKFLEGLDTLERLVTGVGDSLDFGGEGLSSGGKAYQYAEDEATDAGDRLHTALLPLDMRPQQTAALLPTDNGVPRQPGRAGQGLPRQATYSERLTAYSEPNDPNRPPEISLSERENPDTGKDEKFAVIDGREFRLRPVDMPEGDELITRDGAVRLVMAVNPETGERVYQKISFDGRAYEIEPVGGQRRLLRALSPTLPNAPAGVLTSSAISKLEWANATVDGYPLADGFMLMEAKALPDGQVRLDTGAYESIVPLTSEHTVLTANGEPIQPDVGSQLFIVKRDPDYGGIPAGEEPSYAEFLPDGTAYPYISELDTPEPLQPWQAPGSAAIPATSSLYALPSYEGALINGDPVPPGSHIVSFNEVTDGTVRLDANYYSSITPLADAELTTPDGGVIGHEPGAQQFLVQDNPNPPDPTAPGYQPDFLEFSPDGHASPAS